MHEGFLHQATKLPLNLTRNASVTESNRQRCLALKPCAQPVVDPKTQRSGAGFLRVSLRLDLCSKRAGMLRLR